MGSFNISCAVSGLPCTPGDQVYAMLLTRHSTGSSRDVYSNAMWVPRTPAMAGTYYDYGRVDLSDEAHEQVLQRIACGLLDVEAVERGDDRDSHVRRGMPIADYLNAASEDTLSVSCESWRSIREMNDRLEQEWVESGFSPPKPPEPLIGPIPTVGSIVAVLKQGGLKANDTAASWWVNEIEKGEIVVSCRSWGGLKIEDAAEAIASHSGYVGVLARGRGNDEDTVLRVFPKPKADGWVGPGHTWDRDEPRDVALAVIRADVWDALLGLVVPSWMHDGGIAREQYATDEAALREQALRVISSSRASGEPAAIRRALNHSTIDLLLLERKSTVAGHLGPVSPGGGAGSPGITGWGQHYEAWLHMLVAKDPGALDTADLVGQRFAAGCMVYDHLSVRAARIMPSQYAGQDEHWDSHAALHRALAKIAWSEQLKSEGVR